jgi:hypothetical protein
LKMRIVVEPEHVALESKELHMLATNIWPAEAVTPQVAKLTVSDPVFEVAKGGQIRPPVGAAVGNGEGLGVGAVGIVVGNGVGLPAFIVGIAEGIADGKGVGGAVVGPMVGKEDGAAVGKTVVAAVVAVVVIEEGAGEGRVVGGKLGGAEGEGVGAKLTTVTPFPATAALPWQPVEVPKQPSQITYVCVGVPAGTVYWICAQSPQADGATPEPGPVLSYITSVKDPVLVSVPNMRRTVVPPEQVAPGKNWLHILTTKRVPADAVTPHVATLVVSAMVFAKGPNALQNPTAVGAGVTVAVGSGDGAVGLAEGFGDGKKACPVGLGVGNTVGIAVGGAVTGALVGIGDGTMEGIDVGAAVCEAVGAAVGAGFVGAADGAGVGNAEGTEDGAGVGNCVGKLVVGRALGAALG